MRDLQEKFRRFMIGRYGNDGLNQFLSLSGIVLLVLSYVLRIRLLSTVALIPLIYCNFRMFSRNISARTEENYRFYTLRDRAARQTAALRRMWAERKTHRYFRCPQCRQRLRVPKGRGRIQISCPKCGTQFVKKS